jgi:predicted chitinase
MFDRATFFATARRRPFANRLQQFQVDGLNALLDEAARRGLAEPRQLAYVLATAHHETAATLQPIREIGRGAGRAYGRRDEETGKVYYGRGYVQLTWRENYRRLGELLGVDLVADPDRALEPRLAAAILFEGMTRGLFTGRALGEFFTDRKTDWRGARRIVNGTDRAEAIADLARAYHAALQAAAAPAGAKSPAPLNSSPRGLFGRLADFFRKRRTT